ncbi:hypothetical protein D9M68_807120 [compost metagenome]
MCTFIWLCCLSGSTPTLTSNSTSLGVLACSSAASSTSASGSGTACCRLESRLDSSYSLRSLLPGCSASRVLLSITPLRWHQASRSISSRARFSGAKSGHSWAPRLPLNSAHWVSLGASGLGHCTRVRVSSAISGAMPGLMNSILPALRSKAAYRRRPSTPRSRLLSELPACSLRANCERKR